MGSINLDYFIHAANFFLLGAYSVRDILWLRLLAAASSLVVISLLTPPTNAVVGSVWMEFCSRESISFRHGGFCSNGARSSSRLRRKKFAGWLFRICRRGKYSTFSASDPGRLVPAGERLIERGKPDPLPVAHRPREGAGVGRGPRARGAGTWPNRRFRASPDRRGAGRRCGDDGAALGAPFDGKPRSWSVISTPTLRPETSSNGISPVTSPGNSDAWAPNSPRPRLTARLRHEP